MLNTGTYNNFRYNGVGAVGTTAVVISADVTNADKVSLPWNIISRFCPPSNQSLAGNPAGNINLSIKKNMPF